MKADFFVYQRQKLAILKYWGLASVVLGAVGWLKSDPLVKQFSLQAISWGAIDAGLAILGQQNATRDEQRVTSGEMTDHTLRQKVRTFRRILDVNTVLDVGYVLSGLWLVARAGRRRGRRGMGLGIIVQGLFLLLYDAALARDVGQRWG